MSPAAIPRCATCKHWQDAKQYDTGHNMGVRKCGATPMFWDSTEWTDDDFGDGRKWKAEAVNTTAFAQDGSDYSASLYTKPEHGCTMHEAKA